MLSFLVLHSDEWGSLNAVFYKILNFMFVDLDWILLEWFTICLSSLCFTTADYLGNSKQSPPSTNQK